MTIVTEYSWESDTFTRHAPPGAPEDTLASHQAWRAAVHAVGEKARVALPDHDARLTRALALVLDGHVTPQADGYYTVASQSQDGRKSYLVNGRCDCGDFPRAPKGLCKHRLAAMLYRRTQELLGVEHAQASTGALDTTAADHSPSVEHVDTPAGVPQQHLVMIQGKPFVRFAGLLQLAHERGLVTLTGSWTYNDAELSLAQARATFADGRVFEEVGDASPANVNRKVSMHFRRVAVTRAKARALRDALGVDLVAVEELADND